MQRRRERAGDNPERNRLNRLERYDALRWIADLFRKPPVEIAAQRELEEARRSLLEHERHQDYHENMAAFQRKRIASLQQFLYKDE